MNASNWLGPLNMVSPIYGYIMPALISITIVANSLILVVLSRYIYVNIDYSVTC